MENKEVLEKVDRVISTLEMVIQVTRTAPSSLETLKGNPGALEEESKKVLDAILYASYAMKDELGKASVQLHELEE